MPYTGSVRDKETGRLASATIRQAEDQGLLVDGDLTSLANAQAAVDTAAALDQVTDRIYSEQVKRALQVAVDVSGDSTIVTGSDLDDIYNALPDTTNITARMRM